MWRAMASGQLPVFITLPSSGAGQGRAGLPGSCAPEASPSSEDRRSCVGTGTECPWELCFSSGMRSRKEGAHSPPKGRGGIQEEEQSMGVMVQDLQAKGLRPTPPKKNQVLSGASLSSAGRTACLFPSSAPAKA